MWLGTMSTTSPRPCVAQRRRPAPAGPPRRRSCGSSRAVVDDVVAVRGAGGRGQQRRQVQMGDAERRPGSRPARRSRARSKSGGPAPGRSRGTAGRAHRQAHPPAARTSDAGLDDVQHRLVRPPPAPARPSCGVAVSSTTSHFAPYSAAGTMKSIDSSCALKHQQERVVDDAARRAARGRGMPSPLRKTATDLPKPASQSSSVISRPSGVNQAMSAAACPAPRAPAGRGRTAAAGTPGASRRSCGQPAR